MRMSVLNYALPPPANSDDNSVFHSEDNDGVQQTNHPVTKKEKTSWQMDIRIEYRGIAWRLIYTRLHCAAEDMRSGGVALWWIALQWF